MPKPVNKPIVAVDIDEVLTPHFQDLINWYNKEYRTELTLLDNHPKDPGNWGTDSIKIAVERVHRFFETPEFKEAKPFREAVDAVCTLSESHDLIVVTSRDTIVEMITREWLERYFPELFKGAHFTAFYSLEGRSRSKAKVVKELGVEYFIEDSLEHAVEVSHEGIKVLLFGNYPWNQATLLPKGITRVKNWKEVLEYFENEKG